MNRATRSAGKLEISYMAAAIISLWTAWWASCQGPQMVLPVTSVNPRRLQALPDQAVLKLSYGIRTETTINDTADFGIGRRLHTLPALARIGIKANRRLLDVQRTSCDSLTDADAHHKVCQPVIIVGQRVPALRFDSPATQALFVALVVFCPPRRLL